MEGDFLYKVGKWTDEHLMKWIRLNRVMRVWEENWSIRITYYVDKLGEDYDDTNKEAINRLDEHKRSNGVCYEKRRILGGFVSGMCLGLIWVVGDICKLFLHDQKINTRTIPVYFPVVICLGGVIAFLLQRNLGVRVRRRQEQIKRELPGFITNMILLLQAGITVYRAFTMSVEVIPEDTPLKKAGQKVEKEVVCGLREEEALERFSDRCRVIEASRLISVMVQNLKKGGSEISPMLRVIANECWEERKKIARVKGEEATAKLLFPMMLILLAIICIVVTPAILTLMEIN